MNALNEYVSNVDASLNNIAGHSEENKYRGCVVLQNAGLSAPRISKSDNGVSVCIRSSVAKKTVIVSIKKVSPSGWADMPLSKSFVEMTQALANDDFEMFSSNMRAQWADGKRVIPKTPTPLEVEWANAFNASQDFPEASDKIGVFHRRMWITIAWSTAMYRMFSEVLLGAMDDADQEGLGILLGSRSRVMYLHAQVNIDAIKDVYESMIETKVVVMDM